MPDVREAAQKLKSASGQLKLDELALFPKFTLQPGVGLSSSNQIGFPITADFWSIGLALLRAAGTNSKLPSCGAR